MRRSALAFHDLTITLHYSQAWYYRLILKMDGAIADSVYARDVISIGAFNAIVWTFLSLAVVSTVLRLYTRIRIVKAFGADDGLIVFGQVRRNSHSDVSRCNYVLHYRSVG